MYEERLKGPASKWYYYIKTLPENMEIIPVYYSEGQMALLEGSNFVEKVETRKRELEEDYKFIVKNSDFLKEMTLEEYIYHMCLVSSRVFGFERKGVKTSSMIPLIGTTCTYFTIRYAKPPETKEKSVELRQ